jgi:hypothetical protein
VRYRDTSASLHRGPSPNPQSPPCSGQSRRGASALLPLSWDEATPRHRTSSFPAFENKTADTRAQVAQLYVRLHGHGPSSLRKPNSGVQRSLHSLANLLQVETVANSSTLPVTEARRPHGTTRPHYSFLVGSSDERPSWRRDQASFAACFGSGSQASGQDSRVSEIPGVHSSPLRCCFARPCQCQAQHASSSSV